MAILAVLDRSMTKYFQNYKFRTKELTLFSLPIIGEQIFTNSIGIINTMIAATIGEYALSAISVIDSISAIIISLFSALTTGGTIIVAQYVGGKNWKKASNAAAQSILLATIFSIVILLFFVFFSEKTVHLLLSSADQDVVTAGILFLSITCFSYPAIALTQTMFGILRGSGNTSAPMLITIVMNVVNVVISVILIMGVHIDLGNWFSIHIPGYGVWGAAVSILVARYSGLVLSVLFMIFKSKDIRFDGLKAFVPDFVMQKKVLALGIPTSVEQSLFQVGRFITQLFVVSMGTAAMAANSVASSIFVLMCVPGNALCVSAMILAGQRIGRGQKEDIAVMNRFIVFAGSIMMLGVCLAFLPFMNIVVSLYSVTPVSAGLIKQMLFSAMIATPLFWSISFITPCTLRATGDVTFTMIVAISTMWLFRIVFGYLFGIIFGLGVLGIWMGMYVDWFVRGIVFTIRLRSGKWLAKAMVS